LPLPLLPLLPPLVIVPVAVAVAVPPPTLSRLGAASWLMRLCRSLSIGLGAPEPAIGNRNANRGGGGGPASSARLVDAAAITTAAAAAAAAAALAAFAAAAAAAVMSLPRLNEPTRDRPDRGKTGNRKGGWDGETG